MTKPIRVLGGILFTALVLLTNSADAQQRRQPPQQTPPTGVEDSVQLTPAEEQGRQLIEAITNQSAEGLVFEHRPDGTIGLDLQGRFMHVLRATPGKDGRLEISCNTAAHAHGSAQEALTPWRPLKGQAMQRLDVKRLNAPLPVPSKKAAAPEEK